ncbi:hypothetical protein ACFL1A_01645 [Patescibacteria group bacterium]
MEKVYAEEIAGFFAPASTFQTFGDIVNVVTRNVFTIAAIITLFFLVFGGFSVIMGAGGGDTKRMESGKQTITRAIVGLVIIVTSVWIVQIIQTLTGINILDSGV